MAPSPKKRVLMLTHRLPYPPDRGDRIRSYHMLRVLSEYFDLDVACTSDEAVWLQHHQLLGTMAKRVAIQPISPRWGKLRSLRALVTGKAMTPANYFRVTLAQQILQWHEQIPFDVVLTYCTGMIEYARLFAPLKGPAPRQVIDLVDVDSAKWQSYAQHSWVPMRWVYAAEARRLRRIEAGQDDHLDTVVVTTPAEAQLYRTHVGDHAHLTVVPNGVDLDYFGPLAQSESKTLIFVGVLNYRPNSDGIIWFVNHVMPLLLKKHPEVNLQIVGRHPTPRIHQLDTHQGVEVVGSVTDVRDYLRDSAISIAPLLIARGVQNKVLEAMASTRAVVCSSGAAQGIDAVEGQHLLVADEPQQWADQISKLLDDPDYRSTIAQAARLRVEQRYHWDRCLEPMIAILENHAEKRSSGQVAYRTGHLSDQSFAQ